MRQTIAQKLNSFRWATKITASTIAAGSAAKWAADYKRSSRIPDSALNDAAEMLKPKDTFVQKSENPHGTKNAQSSSNPRSSD